MYFYETFDKYAILLISGKKTLFYLHSWNNTHLIKEIVIDLPNSHKTGGQSAQRFERIRDEKIGWYITKIVDSMCQYYIDNGLFKYKGLIVAGPSKLKEKIQDNNIFVKYFKNVLLKTITVAEIDNQTIANVILNSSNILLSEDSDKNLIDNFESLINNSEKVDLIVFGTDLVIDSFISGSLKNIYVYVDSPLKTKIISLNKKTDIIIFQCQKFAKKYGEIIGIKYFLPDN